MRIPSISGQGILSFDSFAFGLNERVTYVVGPNGAGKSNLGRLLTICQLALASADGASADADRQLAAFAAARHLGSRSRAIEVRVGVRLTDDAERALLVEFVRAMATSALAQRGQVLNMAEIDAWAEREITAAKLAPLMEGEIVATHPGTEDGWWRCVYEFTAPAHDGSQHTYWWTLLGTQSGAIVEAHGSGTGPNADVAMRLRGIPDPPPSPAAMVPTGAFELLQLLPQPDRFTSGCTFELPGTSSASARNFAELTGRPLNPPGGSRAVTLASMLRTIFRRALVHTSDARLLPVGTAGGSAPSPAATDGGEGGFPELLLRLKNGDPAERARYRRIKELFIQFTQGRGCEVRLIPVPQQSRDGQPATPAQVPAVFVTVNSATENRLDAEVPIEFAGAGAWEALVLASTLGEPSASIVVLDEPAVALHPSLQRQLGAHLLEASAQFLLITHSSELLPLTEGTETCLVRFDRDESSATRAWPVEEACRAKMARKLVQKGNERLPFASRAVLCEGQDDVAAVMTLAELMGVDLRARNIAVTDCGSRDNLPDYVWFCAQLGLKYLAIMDADAATPGALRKAQAVRNAVDRCRGGELAEFPQNLEATFGVPKQNPSLVPGAIRALPFDGEMPDPGQVPTEVVAIAKAIRRLMQ